MTPVPRTGEVNHAVTHAVTGSVRIPATTLQPVVFDLTNRVGHAVIGVGCMGAAGRAGCTVNGDAWTGDCALC